MNIEEKQKLIIKSLNEEIENLRQNNFLLRQYRIQFSDDLINKENLIKELYIEINKLKLTIDKTKK